mgnify:FL=1|jgi:hypothetical protein|tara:strand:+ start:143 stop:1030 length:888 start_codon:yes stop_codon:yes gene_type:complete
MIFSSKNTKLRLNDLDIIANQCSLDVQASIDPRYDAGQRHSKNYFANAGIGSTLSFSHYLTGGLDKIKSFIANQGEKIGSDNRSNEGQIISGSFGGMTFTSGYLSSYSIDFQPNSPVIANSTIVFFDDLQGEFTQNQEIISEDKILNCKNITIENTSSNLLGEINDFINTSYNYSSEINPVYSAGKTVPDRIYFGKKTVSMGIEVDNPTGFLPYNGISSKFLINLYRHNESDTAGATETFSCFGVLQSRSVSASVGNKVTHNLSIVSNTPRVDLVASGIIPTARPVFPDGSPLNL